MGPRARAVAYSLVGVQMLNLVLLVRDDLPPSVAKAEGDLREMAKTVRSVGSAAYKSPFTCQEYRQTVTHASAGRRAKDFSARDVHHGW